MRAKTTICLAIILSVAQVPASAATQSGNYESAYPAKYTSGDLLPGSGSTASADATASASTGAVTAQTSASSDSPVGISATGFTAGGTTAIASGNVGHTFPVSLGGTYGFAVSFTGLVSNYSPSVPAGSDYYGISPSHSSAGTFAAVYVHFYPCPMSETCLPDYSASTSAGGHNPTGNQTYSGSVSVSGPGKVVIIAGLATYANARGASSTAQATASGTVASISVA